MDIYILRHAIAEDHGAKRQDRDREITREGAEKTRLAGQALRKLEVEFDLVLSSPYVRAWQTASIIVEQLGCENLLRECGKLASGSSTPELLGELKLHAQTSSRLLLVGHEPDLSRLISVLVSGSPTLAITLKKGGLCKLTCELPEPGAARLEWLLTPKHLSRMA